tara:strand:- start:798 stop:1757 length:960 start_codon:yes stop_codon:yes gene_type:complete
MSKNYLSIILSVFSICVAILSCEIILRVKHSIIPNYDIEMWKYAKQLKIQVKDKNIGHVHVPNEQGIFQKTNISTNSFGQRDIDYDNNYLEKFEKRFLVIGSSIPLGWGVDKEKTFSNQLNYKSIKNGKNWIFINGGIGNYNSTRYVNNYLKNWKDLKFNNIIITYFVNDTEVLNNRKVNFFIEHTHIGVVLWKLLKSFDSNLKKENLYDYYKRIYDEDYEGLKVAKAELLKLKKHCDINKIRCILINMPDIHQLNPYRLKFINEKIQNFAEQNDIEYLDLLPIFENVDENKIWNKYQDPHPNEYAHKIISRKIFEYLN